MVCVWDWEPCMLNYFLTSRNWLDNCLPSEKLPVLKMHAFDASLFI